jgi:hypothetical protein
MVLNDKQGNLLNIELFESLAFCPYWNTGQSDTSTEAHQTTR